MNIDYTKLFFGKDIHELSYNDIEKYFTVQREESNKIEFKSYYSHDNENDNQKISGVKRAICALLNSEGGVVIWGAPVGKKVDGKKEKIFQGDLSPSDKLIEKDAFISSITDSITPSPHGIKFQSCEKNSKYIYVIEVDKSSYSPHQFGNTYYMRIDGQTRPAPHHFIEALFKKITFPKLEGYLKFDSYVSIQGDHNVNILNMSLFIFNNSKLQNEHELYFRLITSVGRFSDYTSIPNLNYSYEHDGHELRMENAKSTLYYNEPFTLSETININLHELAQANYEVEFILSFGGKQSPLMVSQYKMNFGSINHENLNESLTFIDENKYGYELSDAIDISEKEKLKRLLGR